MEQPRPPEMQEQQADNLVEMWEAHAQCIAAQPVDDQAEVLRMTMLLAQQERERNSADANLTSTLGFA